MQKVVHERDGYDDGDEDDVGVADDDDGADHGHGLVQEGAEVHGDGDVNDVDVLGKAEKKTISLSAT